MTGPAKHQNTEQVLQGACSEPAPMLATFSHWAYLHAYPTCVTLRQMLMTSGFLFEWSDLLQDQNMSPQNVLPGCNDCSVLKAAESQQRREEICAFALVPWKPSTGCSWRKMPLCIWQRWLQHSVETELGSQMHQPLHDRDLCFLNLKTDFQFKRKECQNGVRLMVLSGETWWNTCDHGTQEVEAGRSGVQSHPWLHGKFKLSLDYLKSCL